jgi:TolB-like protein/DNA-binding winged helix-turn-helix (wHTH) protein/Tfp pilus assembly protein PilF
VGSGPSGTSPVFRFGEDFVLDPTSGELCRAECPLKLERIPSEILLLLVAQRGQIVSREQIVEKVWGKNVFLDTDNSINGAIRKIRQVLGDDSQEPQFVQTITGKGYRFIAPLRATVADVAETRPGPAAEGPATIDDSVAPRSATHKPVGWKWPPVLAIILFLVVGIAAYLLWPRSGADRTAQSERLMLAVLPFENLTGDPGQDYFSDGFTEEMITQLGRTNPAQLGIIARTSVMVYKRDPKPLDEIGRKLGVQYVLEGSVRRDAQRVRITAQLIRVKDQTHLWAQEYDRELKDLLLIQADIAREIALESRIALQSGTTPSSAIPSVLSPEHYEAYDLYLKGRYYWNKRTADGFRQAADYFQQAIDKDPQYARAYAGLADTFGLMSTWYLTPQNESMVKARAAALKALEIDGTLAEAHASLALVEENYDYNWSAAEKEFRTAIQLDPEYATAHQWYAENLAWQGRFEEAFAQSERARQLDPLSVIIVTDFGAILYYARQYDRAIEQYRQALDTDTSFTHARDCLVLSYVAKGDFVAAANEINHSQDAESRPWKWAQKAFVYAESGRTKEANEALAQFEHTVPRVRSDWRAAAIYAYIGTERKDQVIKLLQSAYSEHSNAITNLNVDPIYDPLRGDPQFQKLLQQLNFLHN